MPKPSIRRSLERTLGKGQSGSGDGMIPGIDRIRDAGNRNPRTGEPWPFSGSSSYQTDTAGPISGAITAADFPDVTAPPLISSIGVLTVSFSSVVASTPSGMAPESEAALIDFRNNGILPAAWGFVFASSGDTTTRAYAYIPDTFGACTPVIFRVVGSSWAVPSWDVSLNATSGDVYAKFELWTPTS